MAKEAPTEASSSADAAPESNAGAPAKAPRAKQPGAPNAQRRQRSQSSSMPFITMKFQLKSFNAQKTFDRGFQAAAESLFTLGVLVRALTTEAQAVEVDALVSTEMDQAAKDLTTEMERLQALADANGIAAEGITYSRPIDCEAQVTSPRASLLVKLIKDFDKLVGLVDALWIAQVIRDSERNKIIYDSQRKILRLGGVFRNLATRAMASTQRKGEMHVPDPRVDTPLDPDLAGAHQNDAAPDATTGQAKPRKARADKSAEAVAGAPADQVQAETATASAEEAVPA